MQLLFVCPLAAAFKILSLIFILLIRAPSGTSKLVPCLRAAGGANKFMKNKFQI